MGVNNTATRHLVDTGGLFLLFPGLIQISFDSNLCILIFLVPKSAFDLTLYALLVVRQLPFLAPILEIDVVACPKVSAADIPN
jgi:hypothetical protein